MKELTDDGEMKTMGRRYRGTEKVVKGNVETLKSHEEVLK